jgi:hypothetical protein
MDKMLQLLFPDTVKFRCPTCNSEIGNFEVKMGFGEHWTRQQFPCPSCKLPLCVSGTYAWLVLLGCILGAVAVSAALNIRPRFLVAICAWVLLAKLASAYVKVLFPPKIRRYYPDDLSLDLWRKN